MVASSLAVPIRNLLGGDAVKHSLVCVLMLLSNSAVPRIDLILRDSVENSLIPMLVSLLLSSVPLCLIASNNLVQLSLIRMAMSLADSGLHISVELCQSHRALRKSSSYLMVGADINHNLVANFGTRSDILNQVANVDVDVVFSSVGKNQMQVCTSLTPCTSLSLCLNRTRLNDHILWDVDIHIQISSGLLNVVALCHTIRGRRSDSYGIVGLSRNLTDFLIDITNNGRSCCTIGQHANSLIQCINVSLRIITSLLRCRNCCILTIRVSLCIFQRLSRITSRVKSAFVFIGSSAKTVNLHVFAIELDSTICSAFSQRINGLVRNSDCAHQIPSRCTLCLRIQVELATIVRIDFQLVLSISILNLA